jgi:hypothetical protein
MKRRKRSARLRAALFEVVENQLRHNDPPETRQTLERLVAEGHSDQEAKGLIAAVVSVEIYDILKQQQPFNQERFTAALHKLPEMPWNDAET